MLTIEVHWQERWKENSLAKNGTIKELKVKGPFETKWTLKLLKSLNPSAQGFYLLDLFEANNKTKPIHAWPYMNAHLAVTAFQTG